MIFLAALAPALILLWWIYHKDTQPEPTRQVVKGFFYGGLATFVSTLISGPLMGLGLFSQDPASWQEAVRLSFLGAALPEESAKLLMLWLLLRNNPEFDERFDGIVYAASVGLGFAAFENLLYVLAAGADWFTVSLSRAFFAVPGHFAFAVVMGYYYSLQHFYGSYAPKGTKVKILLYPILLHGCYDSLVFISHVTPAISGIVTLALVFFCFRLFKGTRNRILAEASDNDIRARIRRDSAPEDSAPDDQFPA